MRNKLYFSLKYLLLIYLLVTVVLPMLYLFGTIRGEHIQEIFSAAQFLPMLQNSLVTTLIATLISVVISFVLIVHTPLIVFAGLPDFRCLIPLTACRIYRITGFIRRVSVSFTVPIL